MNGIRFGNISGDSKRHSLNFEFTIASRQGPCFSELELFSTRRLYAQVADPGNRIFTFRNLDSRVGRISYLFRTYFLGLDSRPGFPWLINMNLCRRD